MNIKGHWCTLRLLFLLSLFGNSIYSQNYFYSDKYYESPVIVELGASIGGMNCLTDLGGTTGIGKAFVKDLNLQNTKFCSSLYAGIMYKDVVGVRLEATFGSVKSYDSILRTVAPTTFGRYERNLSFRSNITEVAIIAEFHPLMLLDFSNSTVPRISPYILAGMGIFSFDPQTYYKGNWIDLQPLHLEGQGFKEYPDRPNYSLTSICYPVGIGLHYEMSNLFVIRFEAIYRFTGTDYLDDVSQKNYIDPTLFSHYLSPANAYLANQLYNRHKELNPSFVEFAGDDRGHPNNNDSYFSFNIKFGLTLGREKRNRKNSNYSINGNCK